MEKQGLNELAAAVHENAVAHRSLRRLWKNTGAGGLFYTSRAMLAGYVVKKTEARIAEAGHTIRKNRTRLVRHRVKSRKAWRWNWPIA